MHIGVNMTISSRSIAVAVLAQKAESLGFESLWLPEHPVIPVHATTRYQSSADGAIPLSIRDMAAPFLALARASAVTTRLKLGTGICLAPERNPLQLAKEIATLDSSVWKAIPEITGEPTQYCLSGCCDMQSW